MRHARNSIHPIRNSQENTAIRRPFKAAAPIKEGPRANREIRVPRVQLIDATGNNRGVVSINDALLARLKDADVAKFVEGAFSMILGTLPSPEELETCLASLNELRTALKDMKDPERTKRARLQVVQALINHNDFVTVR